MKREYVIKLTDEEKKELSKSQLVDLNKSDFEGLIVHRVVEQILEQNNSKTWGDVLCEAVPNARRRFASGKT
jgi:hypothetical protein